MKEFLDNAIRQIREFFAKLSRKEKVRLAILAVLILSISFAAAFVLGRTEYSVLYSNLESSEAGQILSELEGMNVPVKTSGADTILVPSERVSELRMRLSASGYHTGEPDYSIFSRGSGFGATDVEKQTYLQYQLQADVRTQLMKMEKIKDCYVLINLPKESSFAVARNTAVASASVMLEIKNGGALSKSESFSVGETVRRAVPGLLLENISIVDSKMNLYPLTGDAPGGSGSMDYQIQLTEEMRSSLETQVTNLLTPVFGPGKVKPSVNVILNFDRETISDVKFAPPVEGRDEGLIVSYQELYESTRNGADAAGAPGTDTNGLGTVQYPYGGLGDEELYNKVLREMNLEINETRSQIERAQGTIRDLSIAILIDSEAISEDYTKNVRNLVAKAIGVSDNYISVERLPFTFMDSEVDRALETQNEFLRDMQIRELIKYAIIGAVILLLAMLTFSFIKTLVHAVAAPRRTELAGAAGGGIDYLAGDANSEYSDISITKPEGIEQLEKFIDKDPAAVAQLLRNWLSDDYR